MTQDDARENLQIKIFGLQKKSNSNRGSSYLPDASITVGGKSYDIELKTGSKRIVQHNGVECQETR